VLNVAIGLLVDVVLVLHLLVLGVWVFLCLGMSTVTCMAAACTSVHRREVECAGLEACVIVTHI